jgi:formate--tetrahydrofolate ligase
MSEKSLRPIGEIAARLDIDPRHLVPYGDVKAKVRLEALANDRPPGKLILVTALTPTDAGEGKTTMSIAIAQGLARLGERAALALREPSLGPVFGMKGGATGGGLSTVEPTVDINLHFNGDFHAISAANNLLAALLDNHLQQGNALGIDPRRILWRRVIDLNDRALRKVIIGLGGSSEGVPRETGFDITPASEVMAVLCLAEGYDDLRARLSRLIVGLDRDGKPVTAADLQAVGAMAALLKDALMPNLVQSIEGVPAFLHGGPFANIAHGCNSVLATKMALAHADWVITEAGFGADLGAEKFLDIKCVSAGLSPAAAVLVATAKALKRHGGVAKTALNAPDPAAVERGLPNLLKHLENLRGFELEPVVVLNRFGDDTDEEVAVVRRAIEAQGAHFAVCDGFAKGSEGSVEAARAVMAAAERGGGKPHRPIYAWSDPPRQKMETIARRIYGADGVTWSKEAEKDLAQASKLGYDGLPLCVAKTQMSFSDDASRAGRPEGFTVHVRNVVLSAGAGFLVPILGTIMRMPGLPKVPQSVHIDLVDGEIVGVR